MENYELFATHMTGLSEIKNKVISDFMWDAYWDDLKPFSDEQCVIAFTRARKELKFFPDISELIKFINGGPVYKGDIAKMAWCMVIDAISQIGNYASIEFPDPVIHSVIESMGGWEHVCMMTNDEIKWKQKEFENLYTTIARKSNHPRYLPGTAEIKNVKIGGLIPEPKKIQSQYSFDSANIKLLK